MILFLIINIAVVISAFLLAARLFGFSSLVDFLVSCFILYFSQIVLTESILGIFQILTLKYLVLSNLFILFFVFVLVALNGKNHLKLPEIKPALKHLFSNRIIVFATCVIFVFGLVKVFINLVNAPFGWDSLNYHFTFPVEWLKNANLCNPITIFDDPSPSYYPINGSLFYFWLIVPLRNVFLADIGQLPFFILAFFCVYGISRKLNLPKDYAYYASVLFVLIPNFFKQLQIAYVDIMVVALFLASLNFLFILEKKFSFSCCLIYGLSLGLLLGVKTVALPYSFLLFIPFVYLAIKNRKYNFLIITAVFIILFGGYSYIRNYFLTNNPLYPLDFKLFGRTIFKGVMDSVVYRAHFKIQDYSLAKLLFHEGLGAQSLLFILPGVFFGLLLLMAKKFKKPSFLFGYFLILPVLIYLVYRYLIPLANTRYLYPLLALGIILGFFSYNFLKFPKIAINIGVIICIIASMSELAKRQELVTSFVLTIITLTSLFFMRRNIKKLKFILKPILAFWVVFAVLLSLILLEKYYIRNEYRSYVKMTKYSGFWLDATKAWEWINDNTTGNNIAYVGRPVPFPLYGTNFKNNVYYVSVNKVEPAKLHYFPNSRYNWDYDFLSMHRSFGEKDNYRGNEDYSVWLSNLLRRKTDYLFVYSLHQTKDVDFPIEDNWAQSNPLKFNLIFSNQTVHIYKVM
ncbi:MAG: hypothetical protein PHO70_00255 [Candidatus Omnitrophica bacterium]|nr:hypothetical protein [Candidatus Omnitrophota bacterium]